MATILLVDDDFMCQRLSSFVLQDRHTVITANNGRQALERLVDTEVDLVITDLSMPVMGGMELLKHIRQHKSCDSLPVIVLSGNIHEDNRGRIREAGANALLTKPASPDDLVKLVQQLLAQHSTAGGQRPTQ
jgi:CheY-like chemotaxis protein